MKKKNATKSKLLRTCATITEGYHGLFWISLAAQVFMVISQIFTSFLVKVTIDAVESVSALTFASSVLSKNINSSIVEKAVVDIITMGRGGEFLMSNIVWLLPTSIIVSTIITCLLSLIRMGLRSYLAACVNGAMQLILFSHLERLPYSYYKTHKSGDLIQTCTRDIDVLRKFLVADVSDLNYAFWMVLFCFSILMSISWKLTVVSLSLFPLMFIYSFFLIKEVRTRYRAADDSEARLTDKINENLAAVRIVKAFNNERYEIDSFEKGLTDYKGKYIRWRKLSAFFFSSSDIFVFGSKVLALCFGVFLCFQGEISSGTLVLSFTFVNMMVWPLRSVATILSNMGQYMASSDRIEEIILFPIEDTVTGLTPPIKGYIVFDHVGFHYDDESETQGVIKDVSFEIKPSETVAIMGKTGSGKSTLSLLLTRLYDYTSGSITIDGVELNTIAKGYLRRNIVPVLQDPFLFSKSIKENIKMAKKEATDDEVHRAAHIAAVDTTIESFKEGYATPVGEKGMSLSGGQKQRVAIARTIISSAPVIIFDDSLSAVDTETDLEIRKNLKEMEMNTTSIIVTHRVSTARDANLIIVLENGTVAEKGTHEELINEPGLYKRINDIQSKIA